MAPRKAAEPPMGGSAGPSRPRSPSARSAVAVVLVVVGLTALAALLDGVPLLAGPEAGLAGLGIGVLGILRLISHLDLRWWVLVAVAVPTRGHAAHADCPSP